MRQSRKIQEMSDEMKLVWKEFGLRVQLVDKQHTLQVKHDTDMAKDIKSLVALIRMQQNYIDALIECNENKKLFANLMKKVT